MWTWGSADETDSGSEFDKNGGLGGLYVPTRFAGFHLGVRRIKGGPA
jgi:hypothetical protein